MYALPCINMHYHVLPSDILRDLCGVAQSQQLPFSPCGAPEVQYLAVQDVCDHRHRQMRHDIHGILDLFG